MMGLGMYPVMVYLSSRSKALGSIPSTQARTSQPNTVFNVITKATQNRRKLSWRGMAQSLEVSKKWLSDSYGLWHLFICSDQYPVFSYWPQVQSQQHQSMHMYTSFMTVPEPRSPPQAWDGDPTFHKWHIYKYSLMPEPQWSSWRLSDTLVWGANPVYSFHKCLHDKTLVPSLPNWEVWGLLKVYSIGIMESKSSLPLFPDYWHRWMVLLSYVHTQWYSQVSSKTLSLQHTHIFFCLFAFWDDHIWQPWWSQTGTGPEFAAILLPIPPQCHHTGILFSINSLPPQLICYNDRKQALHPFISSIKLHQWPYDESAQKRERHCHSLASEKLPDSHMKAVDGLRRRSILRNDSK